MLTLYFFPGACSMAAHIILEESGETYTPQQVDFTKAEQRSEGYLKINPQGRVPVLRLDSGETVAENTAILPYLGKRFGLWPTDPIAEAKALSLIGFLAASVHPAHAHFNRPERYTADQAAFPGIKDTGLKTFHNYLRQTRRAARRAGVVLRSLFGSRSLRLRLLHLGRAPRAADGGAQELHGVQGSHDAASRGPARGRAGEGEALIRRIGRSMPRASRYTTRCWRRHRSSAAG